MINLGLNKVLGSFDYSPYIYYLFQTGKIYPILMIGLVLTILVFFMLGWVAGRALAPKLNGQTVDNE